MSENIAELMGKPAESLLGESIETLLGHASTARLAQAASTAMVDQAPLYLGVIDNPFFEAAAASGSGPSRTA